MDGARFANALVATNASPAEMTWRAGVDALSFGGTKNGLMGVEAVVLFDPALGWELELRRKRAAHLFSKHRYLAAQMLAYLDGRPLAALGPRRQRRPRAAGRGAARRAGLRGRPGSRRPTSSSCACPAASTAACTRRARTTTSGTGSSTAAPRTSRSSPASSATGPPGPRPSTASSPSPAPTA